MESEMTVDGVTGREITDFLLDCDDERYQAWWPGTHLELHIVDRERADHVGDVVLMDEYIGSRRVRMLAEVIEAIPGEKVVWRLRLRRFRLPVWLTLALTTRDHGVHLRHSIVAGWSGRGRAFDPLWRLYFTKAFAGAMDRHAHTEFPLLRDLLRLTPADSTGT
ncbi:hypothetical protein CQY20_30165 [Mycolicibacterium agri]|uniref:Polyketide cyclase n=1 Tax=Mycolicibacterium agri TaxID=36811 RepID=A0A2A7MQX6_MYCAG|nr:hypothetical protein CQY20_30165 [Mycolicibacterium agri]